MTKTQLEEVLKQAKGIGPVTTKSVLKEFDRKAKHFPQQTVYNLIGYTNIGASRYNTLIIVSNKMNKGKK